jgi:hypothetical protein
VIALAAERRACAGQRGAITHWLVGALALLALASAAWTWRDAPLMQRARALVSPAVDAAAPAAALRKCVQDGKVLYTNAPCPAGSQSQAVNGALTVLPALQPGGSAAASGPKPGNVRDLLVPPAAADLKDQRMEAAIGK